MEVQTARAWGVSMDEWDDWPQQSRAYALALAQAEQVDDVLAKGLCPTCGAKDAECTTCGGTGGTCPACGGSAVECQSYDNQNAFDVTTVRCFRTQAREMVAETRRHDMHGILFRSEFNPERTKSNRKARRVRMKTGGSRG